MKLIVTHAKIQHYVPSFLLKGFTAGKKGRLHVFDKATGKQFQTKPHNVAAEKGFYDVKFPGGVATIEPFLGSLEGRASKLVREIRHHRTLATFSEDDLVLLAAFVVVQFLRTKQFREQFADLDLKIAKSLRRRGIDPDLLSNYRPLQDDEDVKLASLSLLPEMAAEIVPILLGKGWVLVRTGKRNPFLIGDHPVALHNERSFGFHGNIGFGVPGVEIHLPLSKEFALYFICPTNVESILASNKKLEHLRSTFGSEDADVQRLEAGLGPMVRALTERTVLEACRDNVIHHNALQVRYSERFVFSSSGDFSLVKEMLAADPRVRRGPRSEVG